MASVAERAHAVAKRLMKEHTFKTMDDTREVYRFDAERGFYRDQARLLIEKVTEGDMGQSCTKYAVSEVVDIIRRKTYVEREAFDSSPNEIVVRNGILNMVTRVLRPHDPEHLALRSVDVDYDPNATCPLIESFLAEVLSQQDRDTVEMFMGYLLVPDHRYKKSLVLVGPKDSGKTTLLSLFFGLAGAGNVSGESLQDLCDNRFSTVALVGKIANIRDDLTAVSLKNAEKLKELTGNFDRTRGEYKGMPSFQFKNRAKLLFACNHPPPAGNADEVYYTRWLIVDMSMRLVMGVEEGRKGKPADVDLADKMQSEYSGLLNLALDGRDRLIAQNGFVSLSTAGAKVKYIAYTGHNAGRFLLETCVFAANNVLKRSELYGDYQVYCNHRNTAYKSEEEFTRFVRVLFPSVVECTTGGVRAWRGIAVKPRCEWETNIEEHTPVYLAPSSFVEYGE